MSDRYLIQQYHTWRDDGAVLVLATVIETAGSTYSKAGRHLLINSDDTYAGLVGGGCLEGDLVIRAQHVRETGEPQLVCYDMRDDADDLWGLGLGCRGMMRLILQKLGPENDWQPFQKLAECMAAPGQAEVAMVVESSNPNLPLGTFLTDLTKSGVADTSLPALCKHEDPSGLYTALHWQTDPWPRLLLLGAGFDAAPIIAIANTLGWHTTVADHRPEKIANSSNHAADACVHVEPDNLEAALELDSFDAVTVMSHHLETDLRYLQTLAGYQHKYIGVLGPAARRDELLAKLAGSGLRVRLQGPVGLDIGATTPQGIALALLAEIHATLKDRAGGKLSQSAP